MYHGGVTHALHVRVDVIWTSRAWPTPARDEEPRGAEPLSPAECGPNAAPNIGVIPRPYLRGGIVNRTYGTLKNPYIRLFLPKIFGPVYYAPPAIAAPVFFKTAVPFWW